MTQPAPQPPSDLPVPEPHVYAVTFTDDTTTWITDLSAVPIVDPAARWLIFRADEVDIAGFDLNHVRSWRRVWFRGTESAPAGLGDGVSMLARDEP